MSSTTPTMAEESGKRKAGNSLAHNRPVKRRASKACCCCRARKVRCDVVENGSPCTNCRLDQVECVVTESKRRKFVLNSTPFPDALGANVKFCTSRKSRVEVENPQQSESPHEDSEDTSLLGRLGEIQGMPDTEPTSPSQNSVDVDHGQHMPHLLCS